MKDGEFYRSAPVYKLFEFQTLEFEKTDLLLLQPRRETLIDWRSG